MTGEFGVFSSYKIIGLAFRRASNQGRRFETFWQRPVALYKPGVELEFRWNTWNRDHATEYGCTIDEIEAVVRLANRTGSRKIGEGKYLVDGRGRGNRMIEVIYIIDDDDRRRRYVIHAKPVTTRRRRGGR